MDGSSSTCPIMQAIHVASFDNILPQKTLINWYLPYNAEIAILYIICWAHS